MDNIVVTAIHACVEDPPNDSPKMQPCTRLTKWGLALGIRSKLNMVSVGSQILDLCTHHLCNTDQQFCSAGHPCITTIHLRLHFKTCVVYYRSFV